jgi:AraC family transcriptional regulator
MRVQDEHVLAMMLRHGAIEVGARRSTLQRVTFQTGEMGFHPRHSERWVGSGNQERLLLGISDAALRAAREGIRGTVELGHRCKMVDMRLAALAKAVNAERIAGFPSGRLFLDSIEQAIAAALVDADAGQNRSVRQLRGGLAPARLRRITELVQSKMEDELSLLEMAQAADLSPAYFSRMFRKSTGETPHQFVLRNKIERAKEMLRAPETRILDVAVACGFKTQQHFARVFRHMCGTSPREYRLQWGARDLSERRHNANPRTDLNFALAIAQACRCSDNITDFPQARRSAAPIPQCSICTSSPSRPIQYS